MISVSDPDVFNILVDMSSLDSVLLVERKDEARRLMDHPPRNARTVCNILLYSLLLCHCLLSLSLFLFACLSFSLSFSLFLVSLPPLCPSLPTYLPFSPPSLSPSFPLPSLFFCLALSNCTIYCMIW